MKRNPELDHEFPESKPQEAQQPIIYRDYDGVFEPYEMMVINKAGGLRSKSWKGVLAKVLIVIAVFAVGCFLFNTFVPR